MVKNKYVYLFVWTTFLVVVIDQITKFFIELNKPMLDLGFVFIRFVQNTGAGFGILQGKTGILALVSLGVIVLIVASYKDIPQEKLPQVAFAFFLGGALGNLIDRLLRGYVVDFIDVGFWPTFNLADTAISLAAIGIVLYFFPKRKR